MGQALEYALKLFFYLVGIAGNIFGIYVAQRWLVATRRREHRVEKIEEEMVIHRNWLIDSGILPPDAVKTSSDH